MTPHSDSYYKGLLSGFIIETISIDQVRELYLFIEAQPLAYEALMNDPEITDLIQQKANSSVVGLPPTADQRIRDNLQAYAESHTSRVVPLKSRNRRWKWTAAAAILVIGLTTAVLMVSDRRRHSSDRLPEDGSVVTAIKAPQSNRATIRLANGQQVALDSLQKGVLAQQGDVQLVKLADGQIAYQGATGAATGELQYNTLYNPRGSKVIDMALSDGSHVWLNAGSSISYPVSFIGRERKVSIAGEAYFEIAADAAKPFLVSKGGMSVKVLGTHFNVDAYDDANDSKVTLLEGSVKVSNTNGGTTGPGRLSEVVLKPAQQAVLTGETGPVGVVDRPDLEAVMAWKNGLFNFNKISLQDAMRQLARWYDVEVEFQGAELSRTLGGEMQRDLSLSEVLDGLRDIGVHFRIEGKKIIVLR